MTDTEAPASPDGVGTVGTLDTRPRLVVFSDDWGRHPSSCQHLVGALLDRYKVTWVNSIGTRVPRPDAYSIVRAAGKVWGWLTTRASPDGDAPAPRVVAPVMWPSFRSRLGRRVNRRALAGAVREAVSPGTPTLALTTLPIVADVVGVVPVERWVYYCVDDLAQWPGLDRRTLETMERDLVANVDQVVAVSNRLVERMASLGRQASLLTHGVDLGHWITAPEDAAAEGDERLAEPLVVFWGVLDRRLDVDVIRRLSSRLEGGTIVLLGPSNNPDPALDKIPGVSKLGPVPYDDLPRWAARASVLIMPYADIAATRAMQPLKLKEYLATGKPVVCSRLPAVHEWQDACDIVGSPVEFVARVLERLDTGVPAEQQAARERLGRESWQAKARILGRLLDGTDRGGEP